MGTTVLLTTHYLEEAEEMCGRVAIMNEGNIIAMDRTRDLLNKLDEKRLIVHLASPLSAVPAGLPGTLEDGGKKLVLRVEHGVGECLKALASLGAQVKELETQAPSLQEAFLKLTRRKQ